MSDLSHFHHIDVSDFLMMVEDREQVMDLDRLIASTQRVEHVLENQTHRVLIDARGVEKTYSFADAYRVVQAFKHAPGLRLGHVAILGSFDRNFEKAQSLQFHFQEVGIDVRAFLEYDEAVAWLTTDHPSDGSESSDR